MASCRPCDLSQKPEIDTHHGPLQTSLLTIMTSHSKSRLLYLFLLGLVTLLLVWGQPEQVVAQDPYPAPATPELVAPSDGSGEFQDVYPAPEPSPVAQEGMETVGDGRAGDPFTGLTEGVEPASAPAQSLPAGNGVFFLWASFTAAILIFGVAVFGSIVLFIRRKDS